MAKTGTLAEGKPKLMDVVVADFEQTGGFDKKEFLRLVASLEQNGEHPLAAAIVRGTTGETSSKSLAPVNVSEEGS